MFHGLKTNSRLNYLYEQALRLVDNDQISTLEEQFQRDNWQSAYYSNIQYLAVVLYKNKKNISTHTMSEIFHIGNVNYNLRNQIDFVAVSPNMQMHDNIPLCFFIGTV